VPSLGSFLYPLELLESRKVYVVCHILLCFPAELDNITHGTTINSAQWPQLDNITHGTTINSAQWPQLDNITHGTTINSAHWPQLDNITHGTTINSAYRPPTLIISVIESLH
jgi:hypothetical protein